MNQGTGVKRRSHKQYLILFQVKNENRKTSGTAEGEITSDIRIIGMARKM